MMRVDLQELDEDNESETESLKAWSEKNPYKVGSLSCTHKLDNTDRGAYSEQI
jgi:hypothetical protein